MSDPSSVQEVLAGGRPTRRAWPGPLRNLTRFAAQMTETVVEVITRLGVSHSFRAALIDPSGKRVRPVYFLVDVVVSSTDPWFLSVCYYEDKITDPEELGNPIPQGLFQETGYCFDVGAYDPELLGYLRDRLAEAHARALISIES
jgi:hypothetical protein